MAGVNETSPNTESVKIEKSPVSLQVKLARLLKTPCRRLNQGTLFRIDVTFEMRTVFCGIHLFIDNLKSSDNIFISNGDGGEESKIAERQRESVCERQRVVEKER